MILLLQLGLWGNHETPKMQHGQTNYLFRFVYKNFHTHSAWVIIVSFKLPGMYFIIANLIVE